MNEKLYGEGYKYFFFNCNPRHQHYIRTRLKEIQQCSTQKMLWKRDWLNVTNLRPLNSKMT